MKGDTLLAIELVLILSIFGIISYFWVPIYEPAVKMVTDLLGQALILVLGYKFGRSMPNQGTLGEGIKNLLNGKPPENQS